MSARRSGPSATCSPAACCVTATQPAPMRWQRTTADIAPDQALRRRVPRRLHRAAPAERPATRPSAHFAALAELSKAAITQARAHYWLGRARGRGGQGCTKPEYQLAAAWPTTFYGQLARSGAGRRCSRTGPPHHRAARPGLHARPGAGLHRPRGRARGGHAGGMERSAPGACLPAAHGRDWRPTPRTGPDGAACAAVGLPDTAVFVARRMGRDGLTLPEAGWPIAAEPPGRTGRSRGGARD